MEKVRNDLLRFLNSTQVRLQRLNKNQKIVFVGILIFLFLLVVINLFQNAPSAISFVRVPSTITPQKDDIYTIRTLATQIAPVQYLNWSDKSKKTISSETKILVYFDTNTPVTSQQINEVEKFINRGGSAIFMVDGTYIPQGSKPGPSSHNLFKLFEKYGIVLQNNLLVSQTNAVANIYTDKSAFSSAYPLWIKTSNFNKSSSAFESITALTFPWSSSIDIMKSDNAKTEALVKTEKNSWTQQKEFYLAPNEIPIPSIDQHKTHNVIVQATTKSGGHLLVIPSSRFVREQFLTMPAENVTFLGNILREYSKSKIPLFFGKVLQAMLLLVGFGIVLFTFYLFKLWRPLRAHR